MRAVTKEVDRMRQDKLFTTTALLIRFHILRGLLQADSGVTCVSDLFEYSKIKNKFINFFNEYKKLYQTKHLEIHEH